jgi:hypothetical protein
VTPGDPVSLTLRWSDVAAKGLYLGLVTYHASATPGNGNIGAVSIVELIKTADPAPTPTPTPTPEPSVEPDPQPSPTPVPPAPVARAKPSVRTAKLTSRTLTLWLRDAAGARVRAAVKRGNRFVASCPTHLAPARGPLKLRLDRPVARGRYTVKVFAVLGGRETVVRVAVRRT